MRRRNYRWCGTWIVTRKPTIGVVLLSELVVNSVSPGFIVVFSNAMNLSDNHPITVPYLVKELSGELPIFYRSEVAVIAVVFPIHRLAVRILRGVQKCEVAVDSRGIIGIRDIPRKVFAGELG